MKNSERGFTALEMLMAVTLSGVVGAMATTVIVESFHQQSSSDARSAAVANVRTALQRTMRDLREASLFSVTDNSVGLSEDTASGTRTVSYFLQTSNGITSLVVSVNGATPVTVVSNVVNDASQPLFSVIPSQGYSPMTADTNPQTCVVTGHTPTEYAPDCVGILTVHLRVMPMTASGKALCAATGGCVIDVSDAADIRNNS